MRALSFVLALVTGCYAYLDPAGLPTVPPCEESPYPQMVCEDDYVWYPGHYDRFNNWHPGGYMRRPGHPYRTH